jgi:hypothetical protein
MIKYIIQKLFSKKIRLNTEPPQRMVRIFLAIQYKTDKSKYMVYIEGRETDLIIDHSQIIGLLTRDQYRDFITKDETIFLVPYNKLFGKDNPGQKLSGKKTDPDAFNIKNGLIR